MLEPTTRFFHINDWIFEIKSIRAIKVERYGEPYQAIANFSLNNDNAYIEGLMTKAEQEFSREDYQTFYQFCQQLGLQQAVFDRFKNNKFVQEKVNIKPLTTQEPLLKLVR